MPQKTKGGGGEGPKPYQHQRVDMPGEGKEKCEWGGEERRIRSTGKEKREPQGGPIELRGKKKKKGEHCTCEKTRGYCVFGGDKI